jgi:hypothetical protein
MMAFWQREWRELTNGLSEDARELLRSMKIGKDIFPSSGGLSRFSASSVQCERRHVVLRVKATRVKWSHAGVRIAHESAVLEVNGLAVARVKLSTAKSHKKGERFEGAKNFSLRFDHASAVKEECLQSGLLTKDVLEASSTLRTLSSTSWLQAKNGQDAAMARETGLPIGGDEKCRGLRGFRFEDSANQRG